MAAGSVRRCTRCVFPETVPGIRFDADGVCSFCRSYKEITYRGKDELDRIINSIRGTGEQYDCIVPMSGGRDSTYALYVAKVMYQLRPLAVSFDNEYRHEQAVANIKNATEKLGVDYVSVRSTRDIARKTIRGTLQHGQSIGLDMVLGCCNTCSFGIKSVPYREALKHRIPLILYAGSQEEKSEPMMVKVFSAFKFSFRTRLLRKLNRLNPNYWKIRYYEVLLRRELGVPGNSMFSRYRPVLRNKDITELHLFDYIPWDRKAITETIMKELGWKRSPGHMSSWKNDCTFHQVINYDYIKWFGCTRDCFGYCNMINSGKMTREEALRQEEAMLAGYEQKVINDIDIEEILRKEIGLTEKEARKILAAL